MTAKVGAQSYNPLKVDKGNHNREETFWEAIAKCARELLMSVISTFLTNPILKIVVEGLNKIFRMVQVQKGLFKGPVIKKTPSRA